MQPPRAARGERQSWSERRVKPEAVTVADTDLTDDDILELWHMAAQHAAEHRPWACGHEDGRCRYRRLNLEEADSLLDEWLTRHPTSSTPAPGAPALTP